MTDAGFDVLVLGGGSAGCVLASRLSEDESRSVCLVEAGPDYGPSDSDGWPEDILDGRLPATSHDWSDAAGTLPAARILGGCSAHNMCTLMHAPGSDYDEWAALTADESLASGNFEAHLVGARERMTQRRFAEGELDPWYRGLAAACEELGLPVHDDANDPGATEGLGGLPFNLRGTTRWNAAFAYLDPARDRANLTILDQALVHRIRFEGRRAVGAEVLADGDSRVLHADLVVLCAGAYGSPSILQRSGIGPADPLRGLGIEPLAELDVGEGLRDHFGVPVRYSPSEPMAREIAAHRDSHGDPSIQGVLKARTASCPSGSWDLHLLAAVFPAGDEVALAMSSMLLRPAWAGTVQIRSADPADLPAVTELDLDQDEDLAAALEGVELARSLVRTEALEERVGPELAPGPDTSPEALRARGRDGITTYFHPVGTCAMGRVTDSNGRVLGIESLHVVDASVIPRPLRASPHLTVLALAERAGGLL